ncbi:TXNL1 protein, partial [Piaya cayana]|nr:TXNL1 protein [Piaya cayana]
QGTAATNNISATPTFLFFRNKVRIDQYQGADAVGLEEKIKQHLENDPGSNEDADIPKGYVCFWRDYICLFLSREGLKALEGRSGGAALESIKPGGAELGGTFPAPPGPTPSGGMGGHLGTIPRQQSSPSGQGPKYVKIFINLPRSMDFEEAERSEPTQALELTPEDIKDDGIIQLRYVKFQNVNSVTLFVQSNHGDEETTRITYFTFIGTPVQVTNMNDFKRVSLRLTPTQ